MTDTIRKFSKDELLKFTTDVFTALGVSRADAEMWADVLIWANLRGVDSHGVLRIPSYVGYLENGGIKPKPNIVIDPLAGAVARLDADFAPGPVAMIAAMDEAIKRAEQFNIGCCAIRNMTHAGAVGYFALRAAEAGFAGIVMSASQPMMAYPGAAGPVASTNPIAIAVPGGAHPPLLFDMATSASGLGKIMQARDSNTTIPDHWGLDENGQPTTDPHQVAMLAPLGGAKGAGLSLMIECLTSLAVANPVIEPVLRTGKGIPGRPINGMVMALDMAAFGDLDVYRENVDALADGIVAQPKSAGTDQIYAPGERGDAVRAEREANGIPLPQGTIDRLKPIADKLKLPLPTAI